ncbi:MAG: ABC transporter ATP-binding protein [Elusimicrobiota bacterium]
MSSSTKSIDLDNVIKSFREGAQEVSVLKNINLKCYHGKWYTIYGASGSGKTTLLNIAGGLERPDGGRVNYAGTDVYGMSDSLLSQWRNSKIGFVFQFFHLIPELNVLNNIQLPLKINRIRMDKSWFSKVINMLNIDNLLDRKPYTLSGGEKQRVAMARAVINRPDFVIADEPTGNLDSDNSMRVIELLLGLKDESGIGIIMATHEKDLMDVGEERLRLKDGTIVLNAE